MGLSFTVGNPSDALLPPYCDLVRDRLAREFGPAVVLGSAEEPETYGELAWSGWAGLQERASGAMGDDRLPHLLSMAAWNGCYVPAETEPATFRFPGHKTPLDVGSLPALLRELEAFGAAAGLPTDDAGLYDLLMKLDEDDDTDLEVYATLLRCGRVAVRRRQPLWVVK